MSIGQARKSLWIETYVPNNYPGSKEVRLVRACGSKHGYCGSGKE